MARKLPLLRTETPLRKRPFMARNHSRLSRKGLLSTLVGIVAILAGAVTAAAATIPSPLRYVRQPGYAVERAADASERLLDLDVRGLAQLRAVSEKESVTLQNFPFAPGATGDLVLERFEVASPEGRTLIEGAAGETSAPLPRGVHFEGHLEGEPGSRVYLGAPGDFVVAILQTSAGIVYVGPDGPASGPVQHVVRRSDSPRNAEFAPLDWRCDADELEAAPANVDVSPFSRLTKPAAASVSALQAASLKDAAVDIETDQELLAKFAGSVTGMTAYITTLMGAISVIY